MFASKTWCYAVCLGLEHMGLTAGAHGLNTLGLQEKFFVQLEWVLALEKRYVNILEAGLVHIAYEPAHMQSLTFGAKDAATHFEELQGLLRESFRATDLIARMGFEVWILTPFTQADPVTKKIEHLLTAAKHCGVAIAQHQIKVHLIKDHLSIDKSRAPDGLAFLNQLALA
jgi:hypothetical protein